jgi:hypothetical protein
MAQGEPSSDIYKEVTAVEEFALMVTENRSDCRCRLSPHAQDTNRNVQERGHKPQRQAEVEAPLENNYDDVALN